MRKERVALLMLLLINVLLGARLLKQDFLAAATVQAGQTNEQKSSAPKWEYCAITGAEWVSHIGATGAKATITYFELNGGRVDNVEYRPGQRMDGTEMLKEARAKAIAKLGREGWEMLIQPTNSDGHGPLYFRRALP
jgi:hypothetical protein